MARQRSPDHMPPDGAAYEPTLLRVLIIERHWQKFSTFAAQFARAAMELAEREREPSLRKVTVSPRQFERWYSGRVKTEPYPDASRVLEYMFGYPVRQLLSSAPRQEKPVQHSSSPTSDALESTDDIQDLVTWVTGSNTSNDAIEQVARACAYLAVAHTKLPPRNVLDEVLKLHQQAYVYLRSGKLRLRQTRELLRIESDLLAHACVLLGDLGQDKSAARYGSAALLFAQEAESNEAIAWSAQAKTARWQERYVESAELARRGFEVSAATATRIELAYREANAIALFGDVARAREALKRAEKTAEALHVNDSGKSVWSFPVQRQAIFSLSVAIHTGDPDAALRAAAMADAGWTSGDPRVPATWAQIRAGSGIAYLMKDALDGAIEEIRPVLDLPPELRIDTVTGYLRKLDRLLDQSRFASNKDVVELRQRIREFNSLSPAA